MPSSHSSGIGTIRVFLSAFYFFFCCVLGLIFSHWGVYLSDKGYSASQIATMSAIFLSANIFAPSICAYLIDRTQNRLLVIRTSLCLSMAFFVMLFFITTPALAFIAYAFFSACFHGVISQVEVITLSQAQTKGADYSRIRVWGSIGFIASAYAAGVMADSFGPLLVPLAVLGSMVFLICSTFGLPSTDTPAETESQGRQPLRFIFKNKRILAFFFMVAAINFSHGGYYTFFSIYLQQHDYSKTEIGSFWSIAVIAEVLMFITLKNVMRRHSTARLVTLCMILTVVRWFVTASVPGNVWLIIFAQTMHAFSFAAAHSVIIDIVRKIFGSGNESQSMAFYAGALVSAPAATGSMISGYVWAYSPNAVFWMAGSAVGLAWIMASLMGWQKILENKPRAENEARADKPIN